MKRQNVIGAAISALGLAALMPLTPVYAQSSDMRAVAPGPSASSTITPEQLSAWLHFIGTELRALRTDVTQLRLEAQEARVATLEAELQKIRKRLEDLQLEETQQQQQIAEMNALATQPLDPEQKSQLDTLRAELNGASVNRVRAESISTAKTEAEMMRRLEIEKTHHAKLQLVARQLTEESPSK